MRSRVHQLGALGRSQLVARYLELHPAAPIHAQQAAAQYWSAERLISLILGAEERQAATAGERGR